MMVAIEVTILSMIRRSVTSVSSDHKLLTISGFNSRGLAGIISRMKICFDIALVVSAMPLLASWAMRPPLVPVQILIGVVLSSCMALFWVRSNHGLRKQMYERIYGPGVKAVRLEWWEADLDPAFKRLMKRWSARWFKNGR